MRLIDEDKLINAIRLYPISVRFIAERIDIIDIIERQPTVDAVPVVHGQWMQLNNTQEHYCSECGVSFNLYAYCKLDYHYCPSCGAKMDGGLADDD